MKCYAIVQQDRIGYFLWLREGKLEFAEHAAVVTVLEGEDAATLEEEAEGLIDFLRHGAVRSS